MTPRWAAAGPAPSRAWRFLRRKINWFRISRSSIGSANLLETGPGSKARPSRAINRRHQRACRIIGLDGADSPSRARRRAPRPKPGAWISRRAWQGNDRDIRCLIRSATRFDPTAPRNNLARALPKNRQAIFVNCVSSDAFCQMPWPPFAALLTLTRKCWISLRPPAKVISSSNSSAPAKFGVAR